MPRALMPFRFIFAPRRMLFAAAAAALMIIFFHLSLRYFSCADTRLSLCYLCAPL